jgi:hypothetical protein
LEWFTVFYIVAGGRADNFRVYGKRTKCSNASAVVLLITCVAISTAKAQNQTPSPSSSVTPVFRANARLVQVDVVVTDKSGNPGIGLNKSDFTVLQDGKTQTVMAFEAHVPVPAGTRALQPTAPKPPLPPNTYTNQPPIITGQSCLQLAPAISTRSDPWRDSRSFLSNVETTGALLADSRVAVYPVDVRGLQTTGIDVSVAAGESTAFIGAADPYTGSIDNHRFAVASPDKNDNQTTYHHIEVKLNRGDVGLSYRRGYYYVVPKSSAGAAAESLRDLLGASMLPATSLSFRVILKPVRADEVLDFDAVPNRLAACRFPASEKATDAPEFRCSALAVIPRVRESDMVLDCMAVAFDQNVRKVTQSSDTLEGKVPAAIVLPF